MITTHKPLTPSAKMTLLAAAHLKGEPGEVFSAEELQEYMASGVYDYGRIERTVRGLKGKSLNALCRRGFADITDTGRYFLTEEGFEEAMRATGGRGLL